MEILLEVLNYRRLIAAYLEFQTNHEMLKLGLSVIMMSLPTWFTIGFKYCSYSPSIKRKEAPSPATFQKAEE